MAVRLTSSLAFATATVGAVAAPFAGALPAGADDPPPVEGGQEEFDAAAEEIPSGQGSGEQCWGADFRVQAKNAFGSTIMESHQANQWCAKDGKVQRWMRNSEWGNGVAGWSSSPAIREQHTGQPGLAFPVTTAFDDDDFDYHWLDSPIGSPGHLQYIHFTYRTNGGYGGSYQW